MEEQKNNEISLSTVLGVFKLRWPILAIVTVVFALIASIFISMQTPTYSSTSKFYVHNYNMYIDTSNTQIDAAESLAKQYCVILDSNKFYDRVIQQIEKADGKLYTRASLSSKITTTPSATAPGFFTLTVTSADPEEVDMIIEACERVAPSYIAEITKTDSESDTTKKISVYEHGELPIKPNANKMTTYTFVAAVIGFVLTYAVFFVIDLCDNKVYSEDDLKKRYAKPVLGVIPEWNTEADKNTKRANFAKKNRNSGYYGYYAHKDIPSRNYKGKILSDDTPFAIVESFNSLRTNLSYMSHGEKCPVLAITSAFSNTGKSVIMANTAIAFAQLGKKVLLVDGDLRCPSVSKIFKIEAKNGLSDYLAGLIEAPERVRITGKGSADLDIITSGKVPPNPAELLSSPRMEEFLDAAKEIYDIILIDMPPVCEVTDASVVAKHVTAYICAVLAGCSDYMSVTRMLNILGAVDANIAGFVINGVDIKTRGYYNSRYSRRPSSKRQTYGYVDYQKYYNEYGRYSKSSERQRANAGEPNSEK